LQQSEGFILSEFYHQEAIMSRGYWFPAKRYGWGWGLPITWQGWVVLIAFLCLVVAGSWIFPPGTKLISYIAYVVAWSFILLIVCWMKGEPPRWRWGDTD
jgi:hypothetical protein